MSASQAATSETLAPGAAAATTAIPKRRRRWWIIAVFVIVIAAAVAGWYFWFGRNTTAAVHYLTATASTGTIAQSVQADFTLGSTNGVTTIALGGSSAASSSSSSNSTASSSTTANSSTDSTSSTTSGGATASLASSRPAAVSSKSLTTFAAMSTGGASLADVAAPAITAVIPTYGPVGSSVTLVGSGLTGATAVAFNGRAAIFTVNSDTQITATVPPGATSGPVTVTAPGGTATSAASFTVKPTVKPTPSPTSRPSPTSTPSSRSSGASASGSFSSGSTSSGSSSSASSALSGVVTHIWLRAGATPRTLQRLLTVSGAYVYAFVSPTPLWKNLSTDLATGSERGNVIVLQLALKRRGYNTGSINGDYTSATAAAYESWQADQGMTETGVVSIDRFVWVPKGSVLTAWSVGLGNQVSSGTALASVVAPHRLSATALVSQADIGSLKVGQKAQMTIDGYTSDTFTGIVSYISSQPASSSSSAGSSGSTQYSITIRPRRLPKVAKSGMTGTLEIVIAQRENVLLVPTSAVSGTGTTSYVRVMMDGKPVYRQVQTGMATSSYTQITSGLAAGEVVVTGQYSDNATSGGSTGTNGSNGGGFFRQGDGGFPQGGFPQGGLPGGGQ